MYAAKRLVETCSGKHIVAICRSDLMPMYEKYGLTALNHRATAGKITYELAIGSIDAFNAGFQQKTGFYKLLEQKIEWRLPFSFFPPA
jgi:hypothetical protein